MASDKRKKHSSNLIGRDPRLYGFGCRLVVCFIFSVVKQYIQTTKNKIYTQTESKKGKEDTGGIKENNVWNSHLGELKSVRVIWLSIELAMYFTGPEKSGNCQSSVTELREMKESGS